MSQGKNEAAIRPSLKVIAFATSVVRSKPAELSVRGMRTSRAQIRSLLTPSEYIDLLRQHIAKGRRADAISSKHRHLDQSSYWRSEYERTKDALKKAEDQSVDLRREIESLKAKVDTARPSTAAKKRKKQDEDTIPVARSPKRARRTASPTRFAPLDISGNDGIDEAGESGSSLLRGVFDIHATVKAPGKTDTTKLAYHVMSTCSAVLELIKRDIEECIAEGPGSLAQLTTTLTVAGRATASILVGLNRISHVPEGSIVQGKVVHAILQMFRDVLSAFEWLASAELDKAEKEASNSKAKRPSTSKGKSKTKSTKSSTVQGSETLNILTAFLSSIINMLDAKVEANKAVFEGLGFCVLKRLGKCLFSTVFGHRRGPTMEAEILQSKADDEIEDDDRTPSPEEAELEQKRIRMEAPYLIHLLTRIMAIAPAHLGAAISARTGKPKQANNKGSMKGALAITAKDCLQSTLVNAIFGTEGMDENDPFIDCLKMPLPGNAAIPMPKVKEPEVAEWFKGEIWNLLGWEILSRIE